MELVVQLFLAAAVFGVTLSGGSLLWPKFTAAPRPQLLANVRDAVIQTPVGERAANVLGVSDEASVEPMNIGEMVGNIGNSIKTAAQKRVQTIIMAQVKQQVDKNQQLRDIICQTEVQ